jgi:hypothetical protein
MPRGKNYVNQHKGMALKAASKEAVKELCFYGSACQRKDCIYRHEKNAASSSSTVKSSDPCMAYLSGFCSFTAKTCRKRHPTSDAEVEALLRKYSTIPCRFGVHCKTNGCLYMHPSDASNTATPTNGMPTVYPLLHLPQPMPLAVRRPNHNNKAIRRTLMDPNAFPPLGVDTASSTPTTGMNPPVCLPAVTSLGPPHADSYNSGPPSPTAPVVPPALESSTSSASWNLQAQEFVPRGLI